MGAYIREREREIRKQKGKIEVKVTFQKVEQKDRDGKWDQKKKKARK